MLRHNISKLHQYLPFDTPELVAAAGIVGTTSQASWTRLGITDNSDTKMIKVCLNVGYLSEQKEKKRERESERESLLIRSCVS